MTCLSVRLESDGLEYVRQQLNFGHTFAGFLSKVTRQKSGEVSACLSSPVTPEELMRFDSGGIGSVTEARQCLAELIHKDLERPGRVCLLEDALGERRDLGTQRVASNHCFHEEEIYHYVLSADATQKRVLTALTEAETVPVFIAAICSVPNNAQPLSPKRELSKAMLELLAFQAERIVIGAYDGEGYILWTKTSLSSGLREN